LRNLRSKVDGVMPMWGEALVCFFLLLCATTAAGRASAEVGHPEVKVNFILNDRGEITALRLQSKGVEPGAVAVVRLTDPDGAAVFETTVVVRSTVVVTTLPEPIPPTRLDKVTVIVTT